MRVIFDHDGGVDDLLSLMLLLSMEHIELLAVTITPADCFLRDATESTFKILKLMGKAHIPVGQGRLHGQNAFPQDWRAQPKICNAMPMMLNTDISEMSVSQMAADQLIANLLDNAQEKVTVLMTGPCTNLVAAIHNNVVRKEKLEQVVWMGGAVNVPGNVVTFNHNSSAEWNVFWDPEAGASLFAMGLNIKLIALDATNSLPIDMGFLQRLAQAKDAPLAQLACQFWATTINTLPCYEFTYYMWDVLATSYLAVQSEAIAFKTMELNVSTQEPNQGQTVACEGNGQWVDVAVKADKDKVLDYVYGQFVGYAVTQ